MKFKRCRKGEGCGHRCKKCYCLSEAEKKKEKELGLITDKGKFIGENK